MTMVMMTVIIISHIIPSSRWATRRVAQSSLALEQAGWLACSVSSARIRAAAMLTQEGKPFLLPQGKARAAPMGQRSKPPLEIVHIQLDGSNQRLLPAALGPRLGSSITVGSNPCLGSCITVRSESFSIKALNGVLVCPISHTATRWSEQCNLMESQLWEMQGWEEVGEGFWGERGRKAVKILEWE